MPDLHDLPDWVAWLIGIAVLCSCALTLVVTIMLVSHFTASPHDPQNCGGTGVKRILVSHTIDDSYDIAVVCNNGHIYRH